MMEAEAYSKAGRNDDALQAVDRAIAVAADTGERWALAEVLRVKARLLQSTGLAPVREVETLLVRSLNTARRQRARCWELRASCDLARLWQEEGRMDEAAQLLQATYDQFTEGFDTIDLRDAKRLMEHGSREHSMQL
jgi:predicted ATPase